MNYNDFVFPAGSRKKKRIAQLLALFKPICTLGSTQACTRHIYPASHDPFCRLRQKRLGNKKCLTARAKKKGLLAKRSWEAASHVSKGENPECRNMVYSSFSYGSLSMTPECFSDTVKAFNCFIGLASLQFSFCLFHGCQCLKKTSMRGGERTGRMYLGNMSRGIHNASDAKELTVKGIQEGGTRQLVLLSP